MSNFSKSEKEIYELRKQKIALLNDISNDSFPTKFNESTKISNIINEHIDIEEGTHTGISVTVRGRLLNARSFGKLLFYDICLLYTSPSPRDWLQSRMPSSA